MVYTQNLIRDGKLKGAKPLDKEGKMVSGRPGAFKDGPCNESKEIIIGYYHIIAKDINEAVAIAQRNPEFAYIKGAKIEVRPIKTVEESTSFVYTNGE
jgi:hypothetical protein